MGLDINLVYRTLSFHGFVPEREREIDSFDDIDQLI